MINVLQDKSQCCGCSSCAQRCPKSSIAMLQDNEGFLYPHVDTATCIDCGLCEKVCPMLSPYDSRKPLQVQAAINKDEEIRKLSSSGGIYTLLAENTINEGGVVFGARFDDEWQVMLDYTETIDGLAAFRGSKYVQADPGKNYHKCKQFLLDGRKVLFSGTPCQIAGLKRYLNQDFFNLVTVEVACHGVPSPKVWKGYLNRISHSNHIKGVSFRDKITGWKDYSITINASTLSYSQRSRNDKYMVSFIHGLSLRPSCFDCPFKEGRSGADILLGDFWNVKNLLPEIDDDKGTTAVILYTKKAEKIFNEVNKKGYTCSYEALITCNPSISHRSICPKYYNMFWTAFLNDGIESALQTLKKMRPSIYIRVKSWISIFLYKLIGKF